MDPYGRKPVPYIFASPGGLHSYLIYWLAWEFPRFQRELEDQGLIGTLWTRAEVGVVYRLCSDLDGGFTEQGFLDVGPLVLET